ncbi:hypothetical protein DRQ53_14590 [bacterium]|nr:MAG: hypothetical protein DRQ53_14590 [bacterium]RKZ13249.1 MAG: hypothetical protein DRQ32_01980 [bacterium]
MTTRSILHGLFALCLLVATLAQPAVAQNEALTPEQLRAEPGYVEFGDLWRLSDGDEEVEIDLTQPLLGVVGAFVSDEDPELANLILDLHLVRVNSFSFRKSNDEKVRDLIDDIAGGLGDKGWENIIKVRERGERVNVFVKMDGDQRTRAGTFLSGLTVLVYERGQATFVNVVGRFRLEDIARVGRHFDIPGSGDWDGYNSRDRDRDDDEDGDI